MAEAQTWCAWATNKLNMATAIILRDYKLQVHEGRRRSVVRNITVLGAAAVLLLVLLFKLSAGPKTIHVVRPFNLEVAEDLETDCRLYADNILQHVAEKGASCECSKDPLSLASKQAILRQQWYINWYFPWQEIIKVCQNETGRWGQPRFHLHDLTGDPQFDEILQRATVCPGEVANANGTAMLERLWKLLLSRHMRFLDLGDEVADYYYYTDLVTRAFDGVFDSSRTLIEDLNIVENYKWFKPTNKDEWANFQRPAVGLQKIIKNELRHDMFINGRVCTSDGCTDVPSELLEAFDVMYFINESHTILKQRFNFQGDMLLVPGGPNGSYLGTNWSMMHAYAVCACNPGACTHSEQEALCGSIHLAAIVRGAQETGSSIYTVILISMVLFWSTIYVLELLYPVNASILFNGSQNEEEKPLMRESPGPSRRQSASYQSLQMASMNASLARENEQ